MTDRRWSLFGALLGVSLTAIFSLSIIIMDKLA